MVLLSQICIHISAVFVNLVKTRHLQIKDFSELLKTSWPFLKLLLISCRISVSLNSVVVFRARAYFPVFPKGNTDKPIRASETGIAVELCRVYYW